MLRFFSKCNVRCFCSPLTSRAHMSRGDGEGASEAPPRHENVHVHQQDSPHGLPPVLPGGGTHGRLLRRHQEQEEEGGVPLHRRHLVLRGDGNCSGVRLLQVPVVTAPQLVSFVSRHPPLPFCEFYTPTRPLLWHFSHVDERHRHVIFPFSTHTQFDRRQSAAKRKPQTETKMGHVCVFFDREKIYCKI